MSLLRNVYPFLRVFEDFLRLRGLMLHFDSSETCRKASVRILIAVFVPQFD